MCEDLIELFKDLAKPLLVAILVNDTLFLMGGNYTFEGGGAQSITGISHLAWAHVMRLIDEQSSNCIRLILAPHFQSTASSTTPFSTL